MSKKNTNNSVPEEFWPKELIIPSASEFVHGSWIQDLEDDGFTLIDKCGNKVESVDYVSHNLERLSKVSREALRYECHTQCCLVGFAALAFNEPGCESHCIQNPATAEFLGKFIELATKKPLLDNFQESGIYLESTVVDYHNPAFCYAVAELASNIFEGFGDDGSKCEKELSPRRAQRLWKETARHFGYHV